MCQKRLWHPTEPCCGSTASQCSRFPDIDWSKVTWKVTVPRSRLAREHYPLFLNEPGNAFSKIGYFPENWNVKSAGTYTYVGSIPLYFPGPPSSTDVIDPVVYGSSRADHYPGGEYIARHLGSCNWEVNCRESLCPGAWSVLELQKDSTFWYITPGMIMGSNSVFDLGEQMGYWDELTQIGNQLFDLPPFSTGSPQEYLGGNPGYYISWRRVLKQAECVFLPPLLADGWTLAFLFNPIDGGVWQNLQNARSALKNSEQTPRPSDFYKPTAMDVALSFAQRDGLHFGFESDKRSPLYGEFVIREGADVDYLFELNDDDEWRITEAWIKSTPWELTTGPLTAKFGHVNRFQRNDNNDLLPAWVELELIPL